MYSHTIFACTNYGYDTFAQAWQTAVDKKVNGPWGFFIAEVADPYVTFEPLYDGLCDYYVVHLAFRMSDQYGGGWSEYVYPTLSSNCQNNANRVYTGQTLNYDISTGYSNRGLGSDANTFCIPYSEQECNAVMVQLSCCTEGAVAWYVDLDTGSLFYVEYGANDCVPFPQQWLDGADYTQSTPTPTPVQQPSPIISPVPTQTPNSTPVPSPIIYPSPSPQQTDYIPPINTSSSPPPAGTSTSDGSYYIDSNIDDIEFSDEIPDQGQDTDYDDTWLDTIFDMFTNHPLISVINGSSITTSDSVCSLECVLWGHTIEISFCGLESYLAMFGYFIVVVASIYAYFIIFRG